MTRTMTAPKYDTTVRSMDDAMHPEYGKVWVLTIEGKYANVQWRSLTKRVMYADLTLCVPRLATPSVPEASPDGR